MSIGQESPSDYGQAVVENVLRVNSQCQIICDIQDWPAIIGKEMPIQIRGLDPQQTFDFPTRQFILETLSDALKQNPSPADPALVSTVEPNKPAEPKILIKHIQRSHAFCLIADVQVNGQDLAQILVDKGYAKKLIIPKTATVDPTTPATADNTNAATPAVADGFVASKSGKVFHKPTCPHAKRIQDNTKVVYQTREEAVSSGRRPCQTCNP
jgi:FlaG/FlaF family flagellin (archaellin)